MPRWFQDVCRVTRARRALLMLLGAVMCSMTWATGAYAYSAELTWLPVQGAAGYRLYIRQDLLPFGVGIDLGARSPDTDGRIRYTTLNLLLNVTNFFALTAYNAAGAESDLSNVLSLRLDSATPTQVPTLTPTRTPTRTAPPPTPIPSSTQTSTRTVPPPSSTSTSTVTVPPPSATSTSTRTAPPPTQTPTRSGTATGTATSTGTATGTATSIVTATPTLTSTFTRTRTPTNTTIPQPTEAPESVPNLILWLDASSLSLNNGAVVASWQDRRGVSLIASQGSQASRPTFRTAAVNGQPALRFDGTDDYLTIAGTLIPGSRDRTVFAVIRPDVIANKGVIDLGDGSTPDGAFMVTPEVGIRLNGANRIWRESAWTNAVAIQVVRFQGTDSDDLTAFLNGAPLSMSSTELGTVNTAGDTTIGSFTAAPLGYHAYDGDIAEIIVYDRALTTAERQRVEQYLANKYAVAMAPSTMSNLRLWLDAASIEAADGDPVSSWPDRSGLGWVASQGNAAYRPTFRAGIGGVPTVNFDGVDDHLGIAGAVVSGSQNRTVFVVTRPSVVENNGIIDLGDGSVDGAAFMVTPEFAVRVENGNRFWKNPLSTQQQVLGVVRLSGTTTADLSAWINGVPLEEQLTTAAPINTQGSTTIGSFTAVPIGYHSFAGAIAEIVVYNRALSDAERETVESYLAAKHNLVLGDIAIGEFGDGTQSGDDQSARFDRNNKRSRRAGAAAHESALASPTPTATWTPTE